MGKAHGSVDDPKRGGEFVLTANFYIFCEVTCDIYMYYN